MESQKLLKRSLWPICKAAILGWALVAAAMWLIIMAGYKWPQFFAGLEICLSIPSAFVTTAIGYSKAGLVNEYIVNGVLGAVLAGATATLCQTIFSTVVRDNQPGTTSLRENGL
jgi:hypothetical protein